MIKYYDEKDNYAVLIMNMIYTNICIQKYVSKPRNDHQFLMTKVAKAMNILNNSTDRS